MGETCKLGGNQTGKVYTWGKGGEKQPSNICVSNDFKADRIKFYYDNFAKGIQEKYNPTKMATIKLESGETLQNYFDEKGNIVYSEKTA